MGLVNLKTNLKSLKYGNDRPGGGSSNQPYIVTPIPDGLTANGPDFLLRQGALQASLDDVSRLTKWFSDPLSVNGLLFTAKQELLERQNIPVPGTPNRIYLPTSTISQAGLNAVGGHLNKRGLDPFELGYYSGGRGGYFNYTLTANNIISNNSIFPEGDGRLTTLYKINFAQFDPGLANFGNEIYNISSQPGLLFTYSGGPNAPLGLGKTNIRLQNPTTRTYINSNGTNPNDVYTFQSEDFAKQVQKTTIGLNGITDYRITINKAVGGTQVLPYTPYEIFNREKQYNISKTYYKVPNKTTLFNPNGSVSVDGINNLGVLGVGVGDELKKENNNIKQITEAYDSDLIRFFFEVIDPNKQNGDEYLFFRAYLNSMGDGFKADWQAYKYVGRAENFYRYGGFSRDVSLSFTIYAHSREEMIPLYEKLNRLVGTTAPSYSSKGYMLGNFIKLTVGTYFSNVPGIINNISLKPSFEAGWDINRTIDGLPIKDEKDASGNNYYLGQVPRMIEVDLTFTPIHDFAPQYKKTFINNEPTELPQPTPNPSTTSDNINTVSLTSQEETDPTTVISPAPTEALNEFARFASIGLPRI